MKRELMPIRTIPQADCPEERVETGPLEFGDDWPGLFIRGDDCFHLAMQLGVLLEEVQALMSEGQIEANLEGMLAVQSMAGLHGLLLQTNLGLRRMEEAGNGAESTQEG